MFFFPGTVLKFLKALHRANNGNIELLKAFRYKEHLVQKYEQNVKDVSQNTPFFCSFYRNAFVSLILI